MRAAKKSLLMLTAVLLTWSSVGCGKSAAPNFYMLTTMLEAQRDSTADEIQGPALAVGPVNLPRHLDRAQMVTRASENQLHLSEFHRWAEPLSERFPRVLAENLAAFLSTEEVYVLPYRNRYPIDYRIAMDVIRFDTGADGRASRSSPCTRDQRGK